jgi:hypothetical protein
MHCSKLHAAWHLGVTKLDTSEEILIIINVGILKEIFSFREGIIASLFNCFIDIMLSLGVNFLELLLSSKLVFQQNALDKAYTVPCLSSLLDLLSVSVRNARIGHRVTMVSVRKHFYVNRAILERVLLCEFDTLFDMQYVVAIDLKSWHCITARVEIDVG